MHLRALFWLGLGFGFGPFACANSSPSPVALDDGGASGASGDGTPPTDDACPLLDIDASEPAATDECPSDLPSDTACTSESPTYDDVRPILSERCLLCHNPEGQGRAIRFDSYAAIKTGMTQAHMLTQIYACRMPPACAPALTPLERQTLLQWFVCRAPLTRDGGADAY